MRPKKIRPTPIPKVVLDLQVLEERLPVSEQISTLVSVAVLSAADFGLGQNTPAVVSGPARDWVADRSPDGALPTEQIALVREAATPSASPVPPERVPSRTLDSAAVDLLALPDFPLQPSAHPIGFRGGSSFTGSPRSDLGGASAGLPPHTGSPVNLSALTLAAPAIENAGTIPLPSAPVPNPDATLAPGTTSQPPADTSGVSANSNSNPPPKSKDPIWVLDANNAIVVTPGVTKHDFSGWDVDLHAQVSKNTVSSYSWVSSFPKRLPF